MAYNSFGVEYIMVGGVAVNLHGYSRVTDDVDVWIKDTKQNRHNLGLAFTELGYDESNMEDFQFVPGWTNFYIGNSMELDIMTNMKALEGYSFDECLKLASFAEIDNLQIPFLHINHLIENKKAVNRPKDQIDVIELEKIKKILQEQQNKPSL